MTRLLRGMPGSRDLPDPRAPCHNDRAGQGPAADNPAVAKLRSQRLEHIPVSLRAAPVVQT